VPRWQQAYDSSTCCYYYYCEELQVGGSASAGSLGIVQHAVRLQAVHDSAYTCDGSLTCASSAAAAF
jgi:hypothetical protein